MQRTAVVFEDAGMRSCVTLKRGGQVGHGVGAPHRAVIGDGRVKGIASDFET